MVLTERHLGFAVTVAKSSPSQLLVVLKAAKEKGRKTLKLR